MDERTCRICGCTDITPCVGEDFTCSWADVDLCTFCADDGDDEQEDDEPLVRLYSEGEANLILRGGL